MNVSDRFFFKKKFRLLKKKDFKRVFNTSQKNVTSLLISFNVNNKLSYPRLGIIISKKISKSAVKRNLIKRIIRESFRIAQYYLLNLDFIILVKSNIIKIHRLALKKFLNNFWMRYINNVSNI
ncbi:Ribonuclease P protein component [Buchnera aphidicola (Takecallis arundicolens)]|uniref:ribonuclease P protein component n=1 Tax=Buchnera aphidicola TaxID=9 RepID=UPI0034643511